MRPIQLYTAGATGSLPVPPTINQALIPISQKKYGINSYEDMWSEMDAGGAKWCIWKHDGSRDIRTAVLILCGLPVACCHERGTCAILDARRLATPMATIRLPRRGSRAMETGIG